MSTQIKGVDAAETTASAIKAETAGIASCATATALTAMKRTAGVDQIKEFPVAILNNAVVAATVGTVTGGPIFISAAYAASTGANAGAVAWTVTESGQGTALIANTEATQANLSAAGKYVIGAASSGVYCPVGTLIQVVGDVGGDGAASTWSLGLHFKACADGAYVA